MLSCRESEQACKCILSRIGCCRLLFYLKAPQHSSFLHQGIACFPWWELPQHTNTLYDTLCAQLTSDLRGLPGPRLAGVC